VASDEPQDIPGPADDAARRIEELELQVRELRNLDAAKSQFLANVSHELRTPLTAIVTYGEVLRDGLLGAINERQEEAVQSIIGSSRQLLSMIEEILTYARTSARAIELEPTEFEITDVLADVHQMSASLIRKKKLHFEARISPDLPAAQADRDKVLHVLGNLIGNAIEFTPPEGDPHRGAAAREEPRLAAGGGLRHRDRDRPAVPRDDLPGVRAGGQLPRPPAPRHRAGAGDRPQLRAAARRRDLGRERAGRRAPASSSPSPPSRQCGVSAWRERAAADRPPRILLVEDNETIRNAFTLLLEESGYEVLQAATGRPRWTARSPTRPTSP
jgi:CheY-like chemotaxis protein